MKQFLLTCFLLLIGNVLCEESIKEIPSSVTELDSLVSQHPMLVVFFYQATENCSECPTSLKHFEDAAKKHATKTPDLVFAKMDGGAISTELHSHEVYYFPTFRYYKNGKGYSFEGEPGVRALEKFIVEKSDPNFPPPNRVVILSGSNFTETMKKEPLMLVEFFAPWCGHCKRLAPEYEKAAYDLSLLEEPIPLATVDATVETELAKQFDVTGYPTLKVFRRGAASEYKGPRDHAGIVQYMKAAKEPAAKLVTSMREVTVFLKGSQPFIIGLFQSDKDPLLDIFHRATENFRDKFQSVKTTSADVIAKFGGKTGRLLVVQPENFHSKEEQPFAIHVLDSAKDTPETLSEFIRANLFPTVGLYSHATKEFYDELLKDAKPLCLFFMQADFSRDHIKQTLMWRNKILKAVKSFKNDMRFALADETEWATLLKDFGFEDAGEDMSVGCFHQEVGRSRKKFAMEAMDEFDTDHIVKFLKKLKEGRLTAHLKSAIAPTRYQGPIRPVVASNIESVVFDGQSHSLLYFYTEACGSCKKIQPQLEAMAGRVTAANKKIRVVKLDTAHNDYPSPPFQLQGPPDFYLVLDGSRDKIVPYTGDTLNMSELQAFFEAQVATTTPKKEDL